MDTNESTNTNRYKLPELTEEERTAALARALEARSARRAALDEVRAGTLDAEASLDDPRLRSCKVFAWLRAFPGIGTARADAIMRKARVKPSRRVRGLGARQRVAVLQALEERRAGR